MLKAGTTHAAASSFAGSPLRWRSPVGGKDLVHILDQQALGLGLRARGAWRQSLKA